MRRFVLILTALLLSAPAKAEEWRILRDDAIVTALTARVLAYPEGASQNFFNDGRTLYEVSSGESWGKWWAAGDRYCSTWPPSLTPSCYLVAARGRQVRFTSSSGQQTVGTYVDLN